MLSTFLAGSLTKYIDRTLPAVQRACEGSSHHAPTPCIGSVAPAPIPCFGTFDSGTTPRFGTFALAPIPRAGLIRAFSLAAVKISTISLINMRKFPLSYSMIIKFEQSQFVYVLYLCPVFASENKTQVQNIRVRNRTCLDSHSIWTGCKIS